MMDNSCIIFDRLYRPFGAQRFACSLRVQVSRVRGQNAHVFGINGRISREMFVRRNIPFGQLRVEFLRALRAPGGSALVRTDEQEAEDFANRKRCMLLTDTVRSEARYKFTVASHDSASNYKQ